MVWNNMWSNLKNNFGVVMDNRIKITICTVLCQLSILLLIFFGSFNQLMIAIGTYFFFGIAEQIFFHRLFTHRAWKCSRWLEIIGLYLSSMVFLGSSIFFVALHRYHHGTSDTDKDPHSPKNLPFWKIQFGGAYFKPLKINLAKDLYKDSIHRFYHEHYFLLTISSHILVGLIIGWQNFFFGYLPGIGLAIIGAKAINWSNHGKTSWLRYRNHETCDESVNNWFAGYLGFDGWHNNHHAHPEKKYYGCKWWELDIAGLVILALEKNSYKG